MPVPTVITDKQIFITHVLDMPKLRNLAGRQFNVGDAVPIEKEKLIHNLKFKVHKFTNRPKPIKENICIFPLFSEFGCEIIAVLYCLPKLLQGRYTGKYSIVLGWHGRSYLYKHLVDEFWELDEEYQSLRDLSLAFHHSSKNLALAQKKAGESGKVVDIGEIANVAIFPRLAGCPTCSGETKITIDGGQACMKCKCIWSEPGVFDNIEEAKKSAVWLKPSEEKIKYVRKYLKSNSIGITARHRTTYGRNLQPIFYERLIYLLEDMGYNPVWLGEKVTTLPCPFSRITDFRSMEEANDLEMTLALVSQLKFTIQFWTASSRLAGLMGTPYIIFESPDQIFGQGQEGMRINLCTKGERKLVVSHFKNVYDDNTAGLSLAKQAITEIEREDYEDIVGMVENVDFVKFMRLGSLKRIGG